MSKYKIYFAVFLFACVFYGINQASAVQAQSSQNSVKPSADVRKLEPRKPVIRDLCGGETHAYEINLASGQFLRASVGGGSVDLAVRVFAPGGDLIFEIDPSSGPQSPQKITVEPTATGLYRIDIRAIDEHIKPTRYEIRIEELLTAEQYKKRLAEIRQKQQPVIKWLKKNAVPLKSITASDNFADLQPLKRILRDVRVLGLGEETHGTREFFQFKHRMLEFMVREMNCRVFAIEASHAASLNINDYVMGRASDGAKALDSQGFWTWNTTEVREMLDWMREYNAKVPADKKVEFVGFDLQINDRAKQELLAYLKKVSPRRADDADKLFKADFDELRRLQFTSKNERERQEALVKMNEIRSRYNELLGYLILNEGRFSRQSSPADFKFAVGSAQILAQYADVFYHIGSDIQPIRDYYMAENIRRAAELYPPDTRIVVWAHNIHISTGDDEGKYPRMGNNLRQIFGDAYYALGFSFNRGGFQARNADSEAKVKYALTGFTVGAAHEETVDWFLAQTSPENFIIDFRSVAKTGMIADWLATPRQMRAIGAGYSTNSEKSYFKPVTLKQEFDGLVYFPTTTRARPNPSVKNTDMGNKN